MGSAIQRWLYPISRSSGHARDVATSPPPASRCRRGPHSRRRLSGAADGRGSGAAGQRPPANMTVTTRRARNAFLVQKGTRMKRLAVLAVVVVAIVGAAVAYRSGAILTGPTATATPSATAPPRAPATGAVVAEGRAIPGKSATLTVKAPGEITQIVALGQSVKAGDPLLALDTASADATVTGAQSALAAARATAAQAH